MAWTSPRTWAAGETVTAALFNVHLRDNLKAIGDALMDYVPTTSGITTTSGTLTGKYWHTGKRFGGYAKFALGASSAITGSVTIGLPLSAIAVRTVVASVAFWDDSAVRFHGGHALNHAVSTLTLRDDASAVLSGTVPFTWAANDELIVNFEGQTA